MPSYRVKVTVQKKVDPAYIFDGKIPNGGYSGLLSLSRVPVRGQLTIELISDTHIPKDTIKESTDDRSLGVMVRGIKLITGSRR